MIPCTKSFLCSEKPSESNREISSINGSLLTVEGKLSFKHLTCLLACWLIEPSLLNRRMKERRSVSQSVGSAVCFLGLEDGGANREMDKRRTAALVV
ncbi:hypothetical protein Hanom_Chr12g01077041 [Helianthus anomalus]